MPWIKQGDTTMHICQRGQQRKRCHFCNTGYVDKLCDFPTRPGKTCDAGMCRRCATSIAHEIDYCPRHKEQTPPQASLDMGGECA